MTTQAWAWLYIAASTIAFCVAFGLRYAFPRSRVLAPPVLISVVIALVLRVGFAGLTSIQFTPHDVASYFHSTATYVRNGQDPMMHLPGRQWNFLPFMDYIHAIESLLGLKWVYAVKIAPIISDCVTVWLVSRLAVDDGRSRALQYAVNPVSLLVVSLHGQVEPVALALALSGVLLTRRDRWFSGGLFLGAAIAAKTWPALIALAVFPVRDRRKIARVVGGGAIVPALALASGAIFLDTKVVTALKHVVSYTSYVDNWGWAGIVIQHARTHLGGYGSPLAKGGTVAMVVIAFSLIAVFAYSSSSVRTMVVLSGALIATAGFGVQYLMWPLPIIVAVAQRSRLLYVLAATGFASVFYLSRWPAGHATSFDAGLSWLVIVSLAGVIWEARSEAAPVWRPARDHTPAHEHQVAGAAT